MSDEITRLSYRDIAERYDLGSVKHGGDFQLTNDGDIKVLNGDIQIGDVTHNALHRFVVAWQFNAPMLKTMVDFVAESERKRRQYDEELEEVALRLSGSRVPSERSTVLDRWHELHEVGVDGRSSRLSYARSPSDGRPIRASSASSRKRMNKR